MGRIYVYRDSRNNLKPFTGSGFPQSLIETGKSQTCGLATSPNKRRGSLQGTGGHIVAECPPEEIDNNPTSITGQYLKPLLAPN
jgi:hypothetical protein